LAVASLLEGLALGMDRILVAAMCTPEEFAVFINGSMEIPFIGILTGSAAAVMLPDVVARFSKGEKQQAHQIWCNASKRTAILILPIGGLLFACAPGIMALLYSDQYVDSANPFRLYLLLLPARTVFFGTIYQAADRSDLILKRAVGTLVLNAIVSYLCILSFGFNGAAVGTVIVFWLYVIPFCIVSIAHILKVGFLDVLPFRKLGAILSATVAAAAIGMLIPTVNLTPNWLQLIPQTIAYVGLSLVFLRLMAREELSWAFSMLNRRSYA
jgi:O-antigen/teichoic acid export membrane protein